MAIPKDYNIVVIGMGFIGGFLTPGYRKLLGDKVETNVFAADVDEEKVKRLQGKFPFTITAQPALELLREKTPDLVIVSVPPKIIPVVLKETLTAYFAEQRQKGGNLPDIITFGPTPNPQLYYDVLGDDINCVKFLPSMVEPIGDVQLQKVGAGSLCFVPGHPFPEDRKQRMIDFANVFGRTFLLTHDQTLYGLSSKNTAHTSYELSYAISDAMKERGVEVTVSQIGSAMRAAYRKYRGFEGDGEYPSSLEDVPESIRDFVEKLAVAWYKGIVDYVQFMSGENATMQDFVGANYEAFTLTVQLSTREELEVSTSHHATKGGVTEKSVNVVNEYFFQQLKDAVKAHLDGTLPPSFFDTAEGIAFMIDMTVNRHAHRLASK